MYHFKKAKAETRPIMNWSLRFSHVSCFYDVNKELWRNGGGIADHLIFFLQKITYPKICTSKDIFFRNNINWSQMIKNVLFSEEGGKNILR